MSRIAIASGNFVKICAISLAMIFVAKDAPAEGVWKHLAGPTVTDARGVYSGASQYPGSRDLVASWSDSQGRLWLFGGEGYSTAGPVSYLNDLWMNDGTGGAWTHIPKAGGGSYHNQNSVFTGNAARPGSRSHSATCTDNHDNLWLYGGNGYGLRGYKDLWRYDTESGIWKIVSGAHDNADVNQWPNYSEGNAHPGSRTGAVMWFDKDGHLMLFGGVGMSNNYYNDMWRFRFTGGDETEGVWEPVGDIRGANKNGVYEGNVYPGSRTASGRSIDENGDLWMFGGYGFSGSGISVRHLNDLWKYDVSEEKWEFVSGTGDYTWENSVYEGEDAHPGSRTLPVIWAEREDEIWLFGGYGLAATQSLDYLNDFWKCEITHDSNGPVVRWKSMGGTGNFRGQNGHYAVGGEQYPGSRTSHVPMFSGKNLWMFGGYGFGASGSAGYLGDLWKYEFPGPTPTTSLTEAQYVDIHTISITFSDEMDDDTVLEAGNYQISGDGAGDRDMTNPDSVEHGAGNTYLLKWTSGYFDHGKSLTLTVADTVKDVLEVPIITPATAIVAIPAIPEIFIINAAHIDRHSLSVTFSGELPDDSGVLEPTNYRISGPGAGTRVGAPPLDSEELPAVNGTTARWADHTPGLANPSSVVHLGGNTYQLIWTAGQFAAGKGLFVHVDDEHIKDLIGGTLASPHSIQLMIPFDAPGCICPTP